jgi:hypothetical protein
VLLGTVSLSSDHLGRGILMAAPIFGLCVLTGVLAGEMSVRPPSGPTRTAVLSVRRMGDYLPRVLAGTVAALTGLLLTLLTATTASGSPDDLGRAGRSLERTCSTVMTEGAGPWPGSFYSLPLVGLVLAGLLTAYVTLGRIIARPRSGSDPIQVAADDRRRRRAARTVTGACGILVGLPLMGCCLVTAGAIQGISCRPGWWNVVSIGLGLLVPVVLGVVGWCLRVVLVPEASVASLPSVA